MNYSLPRGFILDYAGLPGIFPRLLMNFFGLSIDSWRHQKLLQVSSQYSKGRAWYYPKAGHFAADSARKTASATEGARYWASLLMNSSYHTLSALATKSYFAFSTASSRTLALPSSGQGVVYDWTPLAPIPHYERDNISPLYTSDGNFELKSYNPFSSSFNSSFFEVLQKSNFEL